MIAISSRIGPDPRKSNLLVLKSLLAFTILPGLISGIIPAILIAIDPWRWGRMLPGLILSALGIIILIRCMWDFYAIGRGTLAPWEPPKRLVVVGLYRYMRNPMYAAVALIVGGLSIGFGSPLLLGYLIFLLFMFRWHTINREEPWLAAQFGSDWAEYSKKVHRWLPRFPAG